MSFQKEIKEGQDFFFRHPEIDHVHASVFWDVSELFWYPSTPTVAGTGFILSTETACSLQGFTNGTEGSWSRALVTQCNPTEILSYYPSSGTRPLYGR